MIEKIAGRILGGLCAIMLASVTVAVARAGETAGIPPEMVAEYIHAIVQADRSIYSTHVVEQLQNVFDPEFPLVDIYTMGLIYDIATDDNKKHIIITMT